MRKKRVIILAGVILAALAAGILDSRYHLTVTEYELGFGDLPSAFDGFRIVQLSDLHGMRFGKGNRRLADRVKELSPDIIVFTGDFAGSNAEIPATAELAEALGSEVPVYAVSGNHEWCGDVTAYALYDILSGCGVRCLADEYETIEKEGSRIVIAGVNDSNCAYGHRPYDALASELREEYPDEFVLWLGHRNDWIKKYPTLPVDLILSGHAHGGIVRLPFVGGLLNTNRSLGAEYEAGVYASGTYRMVVSRGLGNSIPVPRFLNRPEIVLISLRAEP